MIDTTTGKITELNVPDSGLFGLGLDTTNRLWFTAGGGQQVNYVGVMAP